MHVSLAEKWHRDAGTGTSEMDGDEENGIAMEVQVRMLQDCETCIRTCSARHAVGLRVVARGRQVLAGRAIHARGRASNIRVFACGKRATTSQRHRLL